MKCWCLHCSLYPWQLAKDSSDWVLRRNIGSWEIWSSYQESCADGRGGQEWRRSCWERGKECLEGELREAQREKLPLLTRATGTELKSPYQEPGREAPHLWVSDLQGVCCKVRCRNAFNRVINCCPSKSELKASSGRLNLPFGPKTLRKGWRRRKERETTVLEETCFPSKCAGRWRYASLLSQQGCTCSVLCFCLGPHSPGRAVNLQRLVNRNFSHKKGTICHSLLKIASCRQGFLWLHSKNIFYVPGQIQEGNCSALQMVGQGARKQHEEKSRLKVHVANSIWAKYIIATGI